jgi:hypothetical protein
VSVLSAVKELLTEHVKADGEDYCQECGPLGETLREREREGEYGRAADRELAAIQRRALAEAWDTGFEAGTHWTGHWGPMGPGDPPLNPYESAEELQPDRGPQTVTEEQIDAAARTFSPSLWDDPTDSVLREGLKESYRSCVRRLLPALGLVAYDDATASAVATPGAAPSSIPNDGQ